MSDAHELERYGNELLAAGGIFAVLCSWGLAPSVETRPLPLIDIVTDDAGNPTNAIWVKLPFLKSRYRVTVTMDAEPEGRPS